MQTLDVVNEMIGTLGERPLASLSDSHALLPAALGKLNQASSRIQADGWWFNQEEVTLLISAADKRFYLPNDCLDFRSDSPNYIKRGSRVYNLAGGTDIFPTLTTMDITLIRKIVFEELPEVAAQFIAATAITDFQVDYDGDATKTQLLQKKASMHRVEINTAHIRHVKANLIESSTRLSRLKSKYFTINRP